MTFTDTLRWLTLRIEEGLPAPTHGTAWSAGDWNFSVATDADLARWAGYLQGESLQVVCGRHGVRRLSVSGRVDDKFVVVVFSDEYVAAAEQVPA